MLTFNLVYYLLHEPPNYTRSETPYQVPLIVPEIGIGIGCAPLVIGIYPMFFKWESLRALNKRYPMHIRLIIRKKSKWHSKALLHFTVKYEP